MHFDPPTWSRPSLQVITEKSAETRVHLLMQGAKLDDSGIYACRPSNAPEAKVKVHVISGKRNL